MFFVYFNEVFSYPDADSAADTGLKNSRYGFKNNTHDKLPVQLWKTLTRRFVCKDLSKKE